MSQASIPSRRRRTLGRFAYVPCNTCRHDGSAALLSLKGAAPHRGAPTSTSYNPRSTSTHEHAQVLIWVSQHSSPTFSHRTQSALHFAQFPVPITPPKQVWQSFRSYHLSNKSLTNLDLLIFSVIICLLISRLMSIMQAVVS